VRIAIVFGAGLLVLAQLMTVSSARAGSGVFATTCAVCHQATGRGVTGVYPPLANTVGAYVRIPAGRRYLMLVVLNGMAGRIVSQGVTYNGLMPSFANLSDGVLAATLNHVLLKLNRRLLPAGFRPISASEVHRARQDKPSATAMARERARLMKSLGATVLGGVQGKAR
jgi:cytochrome c5